MKTKVHIIKTVGLGLTILLSATAFIAVSSVVVNAQSSRRAEIQEKIQEKRQEVQQRQEARREARGEKSEEQRLAACERNSNKIVQRMERLTGQAERHLSVISSFQTKVEGFYDSGQLTVADYDELHSAVVDAQTVAMDNVEALGEVQVDIDCDNSSVATTVGLYRAIAEETRSSLRSYRSSLVALISAMRSEVAEASDDATTEDEESEQEEEGSENEEQEGGDSTEDETTDNEDTESSSDESESEER